MQKTQIKEMPDIPELYRTLRKVTDEMKVALIPIVKKNDPNIVINSLSMIVMTFMCIRCETQEQVDESIEALCKGLKSNSRNWFEIPEEIE